MLVTIVVGQGFLQSAEFALETKGTVVLVVRRVGTSGVLVVCNFSGLAVEWQEVVALGWLAFFIAIAILSGANWLGHYIFSALVENKLSRNGGYEWCKCIVLM